MKSCILITSHLNNQAKIDTALKQLDFLKDKGYKIIYTGNYDIPTKIQQKVDYVLYMSENPTCNRGIIGWKWIDDKAGLGYVKAMTGYPDYGYAHLLQAYRGFQYAKVLGFDYVIHLNYDVLFEGEEWKKLITQTQLGRNIVFKWSEDFATNKYMFNIDDFLQLMEKTLPFYKEGNPPGIKKDWFCEVFFKWAIERENTPFTIATDITSKELISNQTVYSEYGNFGAFYFPERDQLLIRFGTPQSHKKMEFVVDGNPTQFLPTPDTRYYIGPAIEGEYYDKKGLAFKLDKELKSRQWVQKR